MACSLLTTIKHRAFCSRLAFVERRAVTWPKHRWSKRCSLLPRVEQAACVHVLVTLPFLKSWLWYCLHHPTCSPRQRERVWGVLSGVEQKGQWWTFGIIWMFRIMVCVYCASWESDIRGWSLHEGMRHMRAPQYILAKRIWEAHSHFNSNVRQLASPRCRWSFRPWGCRECRKGPALRRWGARQL